MTFVSNLSIFFIPLITYLNSKQCISEGHVDLYNNWK
uniref:Uncharacterized protein n=1 Tax=Rhizophora mucronata TaxID=61149 RepID=A0A2P2PT13_RHIMU